ncbi:MAG: DUF3617 family protein, partial [Pseudomonadota bacterium]
TSGDKDCKMTDIKTVGNKTTWKARCEKDGEVMTGTGEQTTSPGAYKGKINFKGKSDGQDMNMDMAYSGKKIGGSCDTEEQVKKIKSQMCDTSRYENTAQWISASTLILQPGSACADQHGQFCAAVKKDAPRDAETYSALIQSEKNQLGGVSVVKECKLDMASMTKSICKTLNGKNYRDLSAHCPAEAKKYRETVRRKDCEGRSYTAETRAADFKRCMSGDVSDSDIEEEDDAPAPRKSKKSSPPSAGEEIKKLKGMFGF